MVAILLLLGMVVLTACSCVADWRRLAIPNRYAWMLVLLFALAQVVGAEYFFPLWQHLAAMALVFVVSYALFYAGVWGGGDSKLATALALWLGLPALGVFVLGTALAGGVLAVLGLYVRRYRPFPRAVKGGWIDRLQQGGNALPYALAITAGFWLGLCYTPLFPAFFGQG